MVTLKALTYAPTGGIVAAPTTSLPETPGGGRNWDYRYCWLRDATLTLLAFENFGCLTEAEAWRSGWCARSRVTRRTCRSCTASTASGTWWSGRPTGCPVTRARSRSGSGNAAYRQLQLDVYGEVMDALHLARERGIPETPDSWAMQRGLMNHLEKIWQEPDNGLWEVRGQGRHFTHSRVMLWVAFDRAVRAVEEDGLPGPVQRWRESARPDPRGGPHARLQRAAWRVHAVLRRRGTRRGHTADPGGGFPARHRRAGARHARSRRQGTQARRSRRPVLHRTWRVRCGRT